MKSSGSFPQCYEELKTYLNNLPIQNPTIKPSCVVISNRRKKATWWNHVNDVNDVEMWNLAYKVTEAPDKALLPIPRGLGRPTDRISSTPKSALNLREKADLSVHRSGVMGGRFGCKLTRLWLGVVCH